MAVFPDEHQDTIDKVNYDGWRYLAERVNKIIDTYGGKGGVLTETFLGVQVNGVEVIVEEGDPSLEWRLVRDDLKSFTRGFKLSVGSTVDSTSNHVICKPVDWYMACISLQIGLEMASLGIAVVKVD